MCYKKITVYPCLASTVVIIQPLCPTEVPPYPTVSIIMGIHSALAAVMSLVNDLRHITLWMSNPLRKDNFHHKVDKCTEGRIDGILDEGTVFKTNIKYTYEVSLFTATRRDNHVSFSSLVVMFE